MSDTTFIDFNPPAVNAAWLNTINKAIYQAFGFTDGSIFTPLAARTNLGVPASVDLASSSNGALGAGLIGFNNTQSYPTNTVGSALHNLITTGSGFVYTGSGEAGNDTAAFTAYYASLPLGASLRISGKVRFTATVTLNRRISIVCPGQTDCFIVAPGPGNNGLVIDQGTANDETGLNTQGGINDIDLIINVYGTAAACLNAVVFTRLDRSRVTACVYAGASGYAYVLDGCLSNQMNLTSSANFKPPIASPAFQTNHILMQKNTTYTVATNTNNLFVILEGGNNGVTSSAMSGEGGNTIRGLIEGMGGRAFMLTASLGMHITDVWCEANAFSSTFDNCSNMRIGPGVINFDGAAQDNFQISNSRGVAIDGYYGGYNFASSCYGTAIGQVGTPDPARNIVQDVGAQQRGWLADASNASYQRNNAGESTMNCLYHNPFMDLWSNGTSTAPDGVTIPATATVSKSTVTVYPGNLTGTSMSVVSGGTTSDNGVYIVPLNQPWLDNDYISFMIPIYPLNGANGAVRVLITPDNGSTFYEMANVNVGGQWTVVRGSFKLQAGQNWRIILAVWNGTTYTNGWQFFVGGVNIVRGTVPPRDLADSHGRRWFIPNSVANTPSRFGQFAYTSAGKLYFASATTSPTDWIILN